MSKGNGKKGNEMNEKDYQEAISIMAVWRHEELTRGAANLRQASRYNDYYTAGLMMISLAAGKPYAAIDRDVTFVYNKTYGASHD